MKETFFWLFAVSLLTSPLYVFESGLPQPSDILMALLILILVTGFVVRVPIHMNLYLAGAAFIGWVAIIDLFWFSIYHDSGSLQAPVYYAFNCAVFLVIVSLMREMPVRFIIVCRFVLIASILAEVIAVLVIPYHGEFRRVGTFNNPNQLGYWSLLTVCSLMVVRKHDKMEWLDLLAFAGAGYLIMLALSKAATIAFALLMISVLVFQPLSRSVKAVLAVAVLMSTVVMLTDQNTIATLMSAQGPSRLAQRLENIGGQGDDSMSGRGYDRIWRYPQHLVFGAGEGAVWRFSTSSINPRLDQREIHSTLGTIFFSYGMVGFGLFMGLLYCIFRRAPLRHFVYSLPIWAYSMTHQGLRFTSFWIFLALVFAMAQYGSSALVAQAGRAGPSTGRRANARGLPESATPLRDRARANRRPVVAHRSR